MNIHQVKIFYMAAQTLSITNTAKKMHLSQPSVSIQIKDLEESLNVRLFDRINRKITLTDAGKVFYDYSGKLLSLIDEINGVMSEFSAGDAGRLVIGSPNTIGIYVLPQFLGEFKELFPNVEISLTTLNRQEATEQCIAGELDFAFIQEPGKHADLQTEFFMRDELAVVCSPKHEWASRGSVSAEMLRGEDVSFIVREEGSGTRDRIDQAARKLGIEYRYAMELSSPEGIKNAVEANLGVTVMSKTMIQRRLENGTVVALPVEGVNPQRDFYLVHNRKRKFSPLMEKFYEFMLAKRELPEDLQ